MLWRPYSAILQTGITPPPLGRGMLSALYTVVYAIPSYIHCSTILKRISMLLSLHKIITWKNCSNHFVSRGLLKWWQTFLQHYTKHWAHCVSLGMKSTVYLVQMTATNQRHCIWKRNNPEEHPSGWTRAWGKIVSMHTTMTEKSCMLNKHHVKITQCKKSISM